jgi:hypothetical protein
MDSDASSFTTIKYLAIDAPIGTALSIPLMSQMFPIICTLYRHGKHHGLSGFDSGETVQIKVADGAGNMTSAYKTVTRAAIPPARDFQRGSSPGSPRG